MGLTQITTGGVDDNINIDSNTLKVDGTNNRVGIGTASPSFNLDVLKSSAGTAARFQANGTDSHVSVKNNAREAIIGSDTSQSYLLNTDAYPWTVWTNNLERIRIDSSGRLLVGTTSSQTIGSNSHGLSQIVVDSNQPALTLSRFENAVAGPDLVLGKSRASSAGSYTVVQNGDTLGDISFAGADGTDLVSIGARIKGEVDGTPGSNDMPGRLSFHTSADGASSPTERMRIDSSGNVGIGTSSPDSTLHLAFTNSTAPASGTTPSGIGLSFGAGDGGNGGIWWSTDFGGDQGICGIGGARDSGYQTSLRFYTNNTNSARAFDERMRISQDGVVGINKSSGYTTGGFASPQLSIKQTATDWTGGIHIESQGSSKLGCISNTEDGLEISQSYRQSGDGGAYAPIIFRTGASERMRVDSSGNVGIGTTSPSYPLDVSGNFRFGSSTGYALIQYGSDSTATDNWHVGSEGDGTFRFYNGVIGGGTERMRINSNGDVYSVPIYNNTAAISANVFVTSSGNLGRATSSVKYKTNIEDVDSSYSDALLNCRPVWYRSTCEGDNPDHGWWGFIAEEVAEIDPRLVHWKTTEITYDEKGSVVTTPCDPEPEGVAYDRFVPHLLNLIKRQKEQIGAMEARLSALEAQ